MPFVLLPALAELYRVYHQQKFHAVWHNGHFLVTPANRLMLSYPSVALVPIHLPTYRQELVSVT